MNVDSEMQDMLQSANEKSLRMYNKPARPAVLFSLWLRVFFMPAVTWHNNLAFLPLVFSYSVTSEELTRKESLSSNQSTKINISCYLYHVRIKTGRN